MLIVLFTFSFYANPIGQEESGGLHQNKQTNKQTPVVAMCFPFSREVGGETGPQAPRVSAEGASRLIITAWHTQKKSPRIVVEICVT